MNDVLLMIIISFILMPIEFIIMKFPWRLYTESIGYKPSNKEELILFCMCVFINLLLMISAVFLSRL